jgi:hypothetical protein
VAIADVNGDGKPDLAVVNNGASVSVLLGKGDGTFAPAKNIAVGSVPSVVPFSLAIADVNGDGRPDLAVGDGSLTATGNVNVLLNAAASTQFTALGLGHQTGSVTYATAGPATFDVTVDFAFSGFPGEHSSNTVTFSVAWDTTPAGVTTSFSPTFVTGTTTATLHATLTITTAATTPAGSFSFTVTGTGDGGVQHSAKGTFTVNKAPLAIVATANTKTYDGNTSASAIPNVFGLMNNDTVTGLVEQYANKNVGTGKTLRVTAFHVNDGNAGSNYQVSLFPNRHGVINPGAASKLLFTTQPPGKLFPGQQFRVVGQITDSFGNPVKLSGQEVTIAISPGGTLHGTTTVETNGSGQAVFANLSVLQTGTYRLTIKAKGLTSATSSPFRVAFNLGLLF